MITRDNTLRVAEAWLEFLYYSLDNITQPYIIAAWGSKWRAPRPLFLKGPNVWWACGDLAMVAEYFAVT
jgi:hypothetical protein